MRRSVLGMAVFGFLALALPGDEAGGGRGSVEINVHFSGWSVDLLGNLIEDKLGEVLEDNLRDEFLGEIRRTYPDAQERSYRQTVRFDSTGHNYGAEFRWYPKGRGGSFSLGLALEKTKMKVSFPEVSARMEVISPSYPGRTGVFEAEATDTGAEINPLSFHVSFRWDIVPSSRIHPYVTFGIGLFPLHELEKGTMHAGYDGTLSGIGASVNYSDSVDKTVQQAIDEANQEGEEINLPPLLPILQLGVGLKAELTESVHLLVDAGIWNGFILRAGLSARL